MTAAEIRGETKAYYRVRELLKCPATDETRRDFEAMLARTVALCRDVTDSCEPLRWARKIVGPVLAAALGACGGPAIKSPTAALRMFGLAGESALSPQSAWDLVRPYLWESALSAATVETIRKSTGLLLKLPQDPTSVDLLQELTRSRSGGYPSEVAHWLTDYFQEAEPDGDNPYFERFFRSLEGIRRSNDAGDLAQFTAGYCTVPTMTREDWEGLVRGRVPEARLRARAAQGVARQFVADYWEKWQTPIARLA